MFCRSYDAGVDMIEDYHKISFKIPTVANFSSSLYSTSVKKSRVVYEYNWIGELAKIGLPWDELEKVVKTRHYLGQSLGGKCVGNKMAPMD